MDDATCDHDYHRLESYPLARQPPLPQIELSYEKGSWYQVKELQCCKACHLFVLPGPQEKVLDNENREKSEHDSESNEDEATPIQVDAHKSHISRPESL